MDKYNLSNGMEVKKKKRFNINQTVFDLLTQIANHYGFNRSETIRMMIIKEFERLKYDTSPGNCKQLSLFGGDTHE